MFASTGASTKVIMRRGGSKSVDVVVCHVHASEERDGQLTQQLNRYPDASMWSRSPQNDDAIAHKVRTTTLRWEVR